MKNYQKILFPCAAALVLSLSAFVSGDDNSPLEFVKEQSATETALLNANGTDVASSSVTFNTTKTEFQKSTSQSISFAESKVASTLVNSEELDIDLIVDSYK